MPSTWLQEEVEPQSTQHVHPSGPGPGNKKLVGTSATLVVTGATLVVTKS